MPKHLTMWAVRGVAAALPLTLGLLTSASVATGQPAPTPTPAAAPAPAAPPTPGPVCASNTPFTVIDTSDNTRDTGSLRYAVNGAKDGCTIVFDPSLAGQTITLNADNGPLTIGGGTSSAPVTIDGSGAPQISLDGGINVGIFSITSAGDAVLNSLTMENGAGDQGGGLENAGTLTLTSSTIGSSVGGNGKGGGIYNAPGATLTVTNSTISGNSATAEGGGIYNDAGATLTLSGSTVNGNTGSDGAGIYNQRGSLTVTSSTISGNSATAEGGGIYNQVGTLTMTNSTLSGNSANTGGGGIASSGTFTLHYSTIAENNSSEIFNGASRAAANVTGTLVAANGSGVDCSGSASTDNGNNLDDDGSCGFSALTSLSDVGAARLQLATGLSLGPPGVLTLGASSVAIDAGGTSANGCPSTDELGTHRPQGSACDIGAYEAPLASAPPPASPSTPAH